MIIDWIYMYIVCWHAWQYRFTGRVTFHLIWTSDFHSFGAFGVGAGPGLGHMCGPGAWAWLQLLYNLEAKAKERLGNCFSLNCRNTWNSMAHAEDFSTLTPKTVLLSVITVQVLLSSFKKTAIRWSASEQCIVLQMIWSGSAAAAVLGSGQGDLIGRLKTDYSRHWCSLLLSPINPC